ncbi:MAG: AAA family ATPase [Alphaproteobacteria bacterium]|nr:AAA family ATPase [Alphaproteobacteria bacterium]
MADLPFARPPVSEPLAARMRPRTLDEFVGQAHVVGPGRLLRRAIEADQLSSVLFFGPPGTGKTTLARVIAQRTKAAFVAINAVLAGVKDIREAVAAAKALRERTGQRTILFVDEVHRFNKAQQDALLPWVEDGTLILVGATTENPYFEVNPALVSRSRLFRLESLGPDDLREVLRRALADPVRGYGGRRVEVSEEAAAHWVDVANGDARTVLNALELAVDTTPAGPDGVVRVDLEVAEESIQRRAVLYDREGDAHFDTISAFIKSIRGSDPDAALYWLARMIYAGEDPRFVFRRLIILASEDVGLADPTALGVVMSCAEAFDRVGLPEGRFPLAQATLHLSLAPKSNSTMGFFDALAAVEKERTGPVPNHLKDPSRDGKDLGHGQGYSYPHAFRDHWVAQQYLPSALQGRIFYHPSDLGHEGRVAAEVARRREAQLAAMVEAVPEALSWSPSDRGTERWLARAIGQGGARLDTLRDAVFEVAAIERHHLVLDWHARSGLLVWEAVRRTPEGHVWARVHEGAEADALQELATRLPELRRPHVIRDPSTELGEVRFERVIGRDALGPRLRWASEAAAIRACLQPDGLAVLVQTVPRHTQRLSALIPDGALDTPLHAAFRAAEEALYADPAEERTAWDVADLSEALGAEVELVRLPGELLVTEASVDRWFSGEDGSYGERLARRLPNVAPVAAVVRRTLLGRTVSWTTTVARAILR